MLTYNHILNDKLIQKIYNNIDKNEPAPWATHGLGHINNVLLYARKICDLLEIDNHTFSLCAIACVLHDTGALLGKPNHAQRSFEFAKNYLCFFGLNENDKHEIEQAILHHSQTRFHAPLIEKVLVLADKLDFSKERLLPFGKTVEGVRQMQHILNVNLKVENEEFCVDVETDHNFNLHEWENYYFTAKIYDAISNLAISRNLNPTINYNNEPSQFFCNQQTF